MVLCFKSSLYFEERNNQIQNGLEMTIEAFVWDTEQKMVEGALKNLESILGVCWETHLIHSSIVITHPHKTS